MHLQNIFLISIAIISVIILVLILLKGKKGQPKENYQGGTLLEETTRLYEKLQRKYDISGLNGVTKDEMYDLYYKMSELNFTSYYDENPKQQKDIDALFKKVSKFTDKYWQDVYVAEGIEEKILERRRRQVSEKKVDSEDEDDDDELPFTKKMTELASRMERLKIIQDEMKARRERRSPGGTPTRPGRTPGGSPDESLRGSSENPLPRRNIFGS